MSNFFVYLITNTLDGVVYVGCSVNPQRRFYQHHKDPSSAGKLIHAAMTTYGVDNFELAVVSSHPSKEEAFREEAATVSRLLLAGKRLYNMTDGGKGSPGREVSEESRGKVSEKLKGTTASDETKKKMSLSRRGRKTGKYYGPPAEMMGLICFGCGGVFERLASKERFRAKKRKYGPFCSIICRNKAAIAARHEVK